MVIKDIQREQQLLKVYPYNLLKKALNTTDMDILGAYSPALVMEMVDTGLTERDRTILYSIYGLGMSMQKLSEEYNISLSLVRTLKIRALKHFVQPNRLEAMKAVSVKQYKELEEKSSNMEKQIQYLSQPSLITKDVLINKTSIKDLELSRFVQHKLEQAKCETIEDCCVILNDTKSKQFGKRVTSELGVVLNQLQELYSKELSPQEALAEYKRIVFGIKE